ncbi:LCP family protein [Paenibacillus lemnae]|uniref:Cell envelope-related transcriptional attenuator domain-containing protein n=1 Tax=Paenibacillus lemnae TaxID=1330551 RepID=A0A848MBL4_PAELE|nr:LCP family protein [Paenibacillus lemnae]NMO97550.1 hypothetical protein [Paenibacillus lemnae]
MKRWKKAVLIGSALVLAGACAYGLFLYQSVKTTMNAIYEPLNQDQAPPVTASSLEPDMETAAASDGKQTGGIQTDGKQTDEKQTSGRGADLSQQDPFTLLVMGVDQREHDVGRSDSIVVLTMNPAKRSVLMVNIPRDTRTEIVGHGTVDKINHAYAFGGVDMAVNTIQNFLDVPIDYYVKVNMEGFEQIIDLLGGVTVDNSFAFTVDGRHYPAGVLTLNGEDALLFSRMRYDDPRGDLGRNERQRRILTGLMDRAKTLSNVTKVTDILEEIEGSTRTNLSFSDINHLFMNYRNEIDSIDQDEIQGTGDMINKIYYYIVSETEKQRIHAEIMKQLQ